MNLQKIIMFLMIQFYNIYILILFPVSLVFSLVGLFYSIFNILLNVINYTMTKEIFYDNFSLLLLSIILFSQIHISVYGLKIKLIKIVK